MRLKIQLERLAKHYHFCLNQYDIISFLDLAHTLRVFTEMLDEVDAKTDKVFRVSKPHKKFKRLLLGADYIFMGLPESVTTYAVNQIHKNHREIISSPDWGDSMVGSKLKIGSRGELNIGILCASAKKMNDDQVKLFNSYIDKGHIERLRYSHYMKRPFIYFSLADYDPSYISREALIKRIANEYDASHPKKAEFDSNNIFSGPVKALMNFRCAGLPLPYFALLHIANDIIKGSKK